MSNESSNIENVKNMFSNGSNVKIAVVIAVLVAIGGAVVLTTNVSSTLDKPTDSTDNDSQNSTQRIGLSPSQIEGDIIDVKVNGVRAKPTSPEISPDDGIRFVNQAGVDLEFEFDREIETFQIPAGESTIVNPESIVYYTANPVNDSIEFRQISDRINVQ